MLKKLAIRTGAAEMVERLASHQQKWMFALFALVLTYTALAVPAQTSTRPLYPPKQPQSVTIIKDELALRPGGTFHGHAFVLAKPDVSSPPPGDGPNAVNPLMILVYDALEYHYGRYLGNDHWIDLVPFGIPVINEPYHWVSPVKFIFLKTFFARKDDIFERSNFFLRAYNERMARMIGIRIVVTDAAAVPGGVLVYETMADDLPLRVFRVDRTNIGQYSPTHTVRISTAADAFDALRKGSFDPERDVLVEEELPADLVSARLMSLTTELGPALSIKAESTGRSLLVLPFEYSRCLRLEAQGDTSAQLIPVNLMQAGLLFERQIDAKISYRFGPLDQPGCRGDDHIRADLLKLREAL